MPSSLAVFGAMSAALSHVSLEIGSGVSWSQALSIQRPSNTEASVAKTTCNVPAAMPAAMLASAISASAVKATAVSTTVGAESARKPSRRNCFHSASPAPPSVAKVSRTAVYAEDGALSLPPPVTSLPSSESSASNNSNSDTQSG